MQRIYPHVYKTGPEAYDYIIVFDAVRYEEDDRGYNIVHAARSKAGHDNFGTHVKDHFSYLNMNFIEHVCAFGDSTSTFRKGSTTVELLAAPDTEDCYRGVVDFINSYSCLGAFIHDRKKQAAYEMVQLFCSEFTHTFVLERCDNTPDDCFYKRYTG